MGTGRNYAWLIGAALVVALTAGAGVSWWFLGSATPVEPADLATRARIGVQRERKFRQTSRGDGYDRAIGGEFSSAVYEGPDGTRIIDRDQTYPSADNARRALEEIIREAGTVVQKGRICGLDNKAIGERALLLLQPSVKSDRRVVLALRIDVDLITIASSSTTYVLEFESSPPSETYKICASPAGVSQKNSK